MKLSQYNWNWWFVLNIIGIVVGFMFGVAGKDTAANVVMIIMLISFIPCLYVGMRPIEE